MRERKPDVITDLWYKSAVIYNCDVRTYLDANGDGVGDFRGLQRRLDYLAGLGITALWLMPFYPSPDRDDGGHDRTDHGEQFQCRRGGGEPGVDRRREL